MSEENFKDCKLSVIDNSIESFNEIDKAIDEQLKALTDMPQDTVDFIITTKINPEINQILENVREDLINTLKEMYKNTQGEKAKLAPLDIDLSGIDISKFTDLVTFVMDLKKFVMQVYQDLIMFTPQLISHLAKLNSAIDNLTRNRIIESSPINYNKLKITMKPISPSDIMN